MKSLARLVAIAVAVAFAVPAAAQTVIFIQAPPYLPAKAPRAVSLAEIDPNAVIGHIGPVDMDALPGDIETLTGGVFHVAGPVTVTPGQVADGGVLISAPVAYAEEMQADERIKVPGSRLEVGQRLYKADYIDMRGGTPKVVTAWCGPFRTVGLFPSNLLLCLEKTADGRAKVYYSTASPLHQEIYADWFAAGLIDRDWAVIDWPKMSPVEHPDAGMTLELVSGSRDGFAAWLGWRIRKTGGKESFTLYQDEDGQTPTVALAAIHHLMVPGKSQILIFDRDHSQKLLGLAGAVKWSRPD